MSRTLQLTVPPNASKVRLDKFLSQNLENSGTKAEVAQEEASEDNVEEELCTDEAACSKASSGISREGIKRLIAKGLCLVNGKTCTSASQKLKTGDTVEIELANEESGLVPEEGEVKIVHEDADVIVCLFKKMEDHIPQIMLRAGAFANGVAMALCASGYAALADVRGNLVCAGGCDFMKTKIKVEKDYHLISSRRRGLYREFNSGY